VKICEALISRDLVTQKGRVFLTDIAEKLALPTSKFHSLTAGARKTFCFVVEQVLSRPFKCSMTESISQSPQVSEGNPFGWPEVNDKFDLEFRCGSGMLSPIVAEAVAMLLEKCHCPCYSLSFNLDASPRPPLELRVKAANYDSVKSHLEKLPGGGSLWFSLVPDDDVAPLTVSAGGWCALDPVGKTTYGAIVFDGQAHYGITTAHGFKPRTTGAFAMSLPSGTGVGAGTPTATTGGTATTTATTATDSTQFVDVYGYYLPKAGVDIAFVKLSGTPDPPSLVSYRHIKAPKDFLPGEKVSKVGSMTGFSSHTIENFGFVSSTRHSGLFYNNLIVLAPQNPRLIEQGDCGSFIFSSDHHPIGYIIGYNQNTQQGYGLPLSLALSFLGEHDPETDAQKVAFPIKFDDLEYYVAPQANRSKLLEPLSVNFGGKAAGDNDNDKDLLALDVLGS
jgi:hypothetical protein